jgi:hypothetical protein
MLLAVRAGTFRVLQPSAWDTGIEERNAAGAPMNEIEAVLNQAVAALRRELLPNQPKKFAILAEGPLEDMRRLQEGIQRMTAEIATRSAACT